MTMLPPYSRIAILGGGAWGTALALAAVAAGRDTMLWAREDDVVAGIAEAGENKRFLPGVTSAQDVARDRRIWKTRRRPTRCCSPCRRRCWRTSRARSRP